MDGPVMRAMTDLMNLVILNLLTLLCSLPVVTAGAAVTAMHYILMQMAEQKEGHVVRTFFAQFRSNLKSATPPWLILLGISVLLYADYRIFGGEGATRYMRIPVFIGAAIVGMLYVWLFPYLARFENRLGASLKNAFLLAVGYLPRTAAMVAITAVVPYFLTQVMSLWPLALFVGISLPGYFCTLFYRGVIEKMVEKAGGT
jgi:uncharacterized membrane protein YesL